MFTPHTRRDLRHLADDATPETLPDLLRLALAGLVPAGFSLEILIDRVEGAK